MPEVEATELTPNERVENLLFEVIAGRVSLHEVPSSLLGWYSIGFEDGSRSRDREVNRLNAEADRLYAAAYGEPLPLQLSQPSYAELCRRRGQYAEAERVEADIARLRFEVGVQ